MVNNTIKIFILIFQDLTLSLIVAKNVQSPKESKDNRERMVHQDLKVQPVLRVPKVSQQNHVQLVHQDHPESQVKRKNIVFLILRSTPPNKDE